MFSVDWLELFQPSASLAELFIRGTALYLFIFFLFRFLLKKQAGNMSFSDIIIFVIIADAAQNGMAGSYKSITEGIFLVSTIAFWDYSLDWLSVRFPVINRLIRGEPVQLVKDGEILKENMRKSMISEDELLSKMREHGEAKIEKIKEAYIEGGGSLSFIFK